LESGPDVAVSSSATTPPGVQGGRHPAADSTDYSVEDEVEGALQGYRAGVLVPVPSVQGRPWGAAAHQARMLGSEVAVNSLITATGVPGEFPADGSTNYSVEDEGVLGLGSGIGIFALVPSAGVRATTAQRPRPCKARAL
jgi:hypothetical protein